MKKMLLLSDTHGYIGEDILTQVHWCAEVWHAGDIGSLEVTDALKKLKPLRAVYGNIDGAAARTEFTCIKSLQLKVLKFGSPTLEATRIGIQSLFET